MKRLAAQSGMVAVEMALVLLCTLTMLALMVFFGRLFWYYSVLKSASLHGARIMAAAPAYAFATNATRTALVQVAQKSAEDAAIASGLPLEEVEGMADIKCDNGTCNFSMIPQRVRLSFRVQMSSIFMPNLSAVYRDGDYFYFDVSTDLPYAVKPPLEASVKP